MKCHICRRECYQGDGGGRSPSMHLAQTDSDMQSVDWESLLADPADSSVAAFNFMAARYECQRVPREFRRRAAGSVYPSRGNLPILNASRTSTFPPKEMTEWR
eukprot:8965140-Pyramimonas_sp.AAC.1